MKRRQNNLINSKNTEERSILRMLCPSLLGIMVCLICLAGMSWAWFTAGVQSQSTITAKSYTLNETVKVKTDGTSGNSADAANTGTLKKESDGTYTLAANTQYVVTLNPSAAPKNGGYCILKMTYAGDGGNVEKKYCTVALTSDNEFNFTIDNGSKAVKCQLIAAWGAPNAANFAGEQACGSGETITLNGGVQDNNSSDQNSDSNAVTEPSTAGDSGTSGNDSSDQNTTNSKNSQQSTDKNTDSSGSNTDADSSGSNTDADSNKSPSGTE